MHIYIYMSGIMSDCREGLCKLLSMNIHDCASLLNSRPFGLVTGQYNGTSYITGCRPVARTCLSRDCHVTVLNNCDSQLSALLFKYRKKCHRVLWLSAVAAAFLGSL